MKPLVTVTLIVIAFSIYDVVGPTIYRRLMRMSLIPICYLVVMGGSWRCVGTGSPERTPW